MRIEEIKLQNYRQYADAAIRFEPAGNHDLHIVLGDNGLGKTNLMNAVEWCLYGEEYHLSAKSAAGLDMLHQPPAGMPQEFGSAIKVQVDISWQSGKTACYGSFRREIDTHETFAFLSNADDDSKVYEGNDARRWVERFIPRGMRDKYFFDAEQLLHFFDANDPGTIKNALFKLSRVKVLDTVISHLDDLRTDLQKKSSGGLSGKINDLVQEKEQLKKEQTQAQKDLDGACDDQKKAREGLDSVDMELRKTADAHDLDARRQRLEKDREDVRETLAQKTHQRTLLVTRIYPTLACLEALIAFQAVLLEKQENKEIPPRVAPEVIRAILDKDHVCLCGEPISEGDDHYKRLAELLSLVENTSRFGEIVNTKVRGGVPALLTGAKKDVTLAREIMQEIDDLNTRITTLQRELSDIHDSLLGLDIQRIDALERSRSSFVQHLEFSSGRIGQQKRLLVSSADRLQQLEGDLDKAMQQANVAKATLSRIAVVDRARQACDNARQERIGLIRSAVEHDFQDRLGELMWKTQSFASVDLDINYGVHVRDDRGHDALGTMSQGETQAVAIAFTLALHTVSGYEGPLMIDAPLAKTTGRMRQNMAQMLLELSKSKQVVMFVMPSEFTSEAKEVFQGNTATFNELVQGRYEKETTFGMRG